jgi:hypothetical protein
VKSQNSGKKFVDFRSKVYLSGNFFAMTVFLFLFLSTAIRTFKKAKAKTKCSMVFS